MYDKKLKSNNRTGHKLFAIEITTRDFYHDYPNNPYIDALYTSGNIHSRYKIITLGHYLQNVKYTQKSRSAIQYQIPDRYIVKTEAASKNVRCEMKYILVNKVLYTITWKEDQAEYSISSEQSASGVINAFLKRIDRKNFRLSGIHVFRFDIKILHQARIGKLSIEKPIIIDKRKRPLNEVQSVSQQNKRFASFGRDAHNKIKQLILQHQMLSESEDPVHLCNMELEYEDHIINIKYNLSLDHTKLDAYVRACNKALLGCDRYRRLAAIKARLIQLDQQLILDDEEFHDNSNGILVNEQEIGNGAYRSIRTLLKILIPIWNKSNPPILQSGDTINLKLEKEKYETLAKVGYLFKYQLQDLQENRIHDNNGVHWPVEKSNLTNSEIDNFEIKHIPEFLRNLKQKNLELRYFSASSIEKKNHNQVRLFFCGITIGGGIKEKPVVYDIMEFENCQLYYLINNTPQEIQMRHINVKDKENKE
ncbi:hypothetical protein C1645_812817 [Glomus cerebriforme]|uniref:Uncharacterized protein n=1 Tax=Glomus cerebriforme TaxID=658196 RepID=A0A397TPJ9_9GLOM|nr:hypothetical protein C1645_812817 [Glomus cerebriforme]